MPRTLLTPLRASLIGVIGIIACWSLATPRYAGPDEPSHAIASAALVRGDRTGHQLGVSSTEFDVPSMVGDPNPGCFAFSLGTPAACAGPPVDSPATVQRESSSYGYPVFGHLLPGLASLIPSPWWYLYIARLFNAIVPVAMTISAISRCRRSTNSWMVYGLLVGMSPIVWFSMAVVNPSSVAISGGLALWAALLVPRPQRPLTDVSAARQRHWTSGADPLLVAGWLVAMLPRRDGPLWATLILLYACVANHELPSDVWRRAGRFGQVLVVISLPLPLLPLMMNGYDQQSLLMAVVPLSLPVIEVVARLWRRLPTPRIRPWFVVVAGMATTVAALVAVNMFRPGGPSSRATIGVITQTGDHLRQMVGNLGWLDTPIPEFAMLLWWTVLGVLTALALLATPRAVGIAAGVLAGGIVTAWVLVLGVGGEASGSWQGRYTMPLIVGVPMLLARGFRIDAPSERRIRHAITWSMWVIWNGAFYAAMRRWGAGSDGTVFPWRWTTWDSPGHPAVYLIIHAAVTGCLIAATLRSHRDADLQGDTATGILDGS